jgi:hypothetical protein
MTPPLLRPLTAGEILDVSFLLYRQHFTALAAVALVCSGLPGLLRIYIEAAGGPFAQLPLMLLYSVLAVVLGAIGTAATVYIVSESYLGRPLGAADALARAMPLLWRLVVCSILLMLVLLSGFVLLVFPAVILACGLLVAVPAIVLEPGQTPTGALGRSWSLTRGARLRMLGLLVTLVILVYVVPFISVTGIAALLLSAVDFTGDQPSPGALFAVALVGVVQMLVYPLFYCVLTVAYYDLRVRKEGFDLEMLASTLQPA